MMPKSCWALHSLIPLKCRVASFLQWFFNSWHSNTPAIDQSCSCLRLWYVDCKHHWPPSSDVAWNGLCQLLHWSQVSPSFLTHQMFWTVHIWQWYLSFIKLDAYLYNIHIKVSCHLEICIYVNIVYKYILYIFVCSYLVRLTWQWCLFFHGADCIWQCVDQTA